MPAESERCAYSRGYSSGYEAGFSEGMKAGAEAAANIYQHQLVQLGDREYRPPSLQETLRFTVDDEPSNGNGHGHGRRS